MNKKEYQVIILAGGLGTRLRSVTGEKPKALVEICNKPFIDYQIEYLRNQNIKEIIFALGYQSDMLIEHLTGKYEDIHFSVETQSLGTGGALALAYKNFNEILDDDFFVINGDTLINVSYDQLAKFHKDRNASLSIGLIEIKDPDRYGTVEIMDNRITKFNEKSIITDSAFINAGIYLINNEAMKSLPNEEVFSLERKFFPEYILHGIHACKMKYDYFIDIGTPESYKQLVKRIEEYGTWY